MGSGRAKQGSGKIKQSNRVKGNWLLAEDLTLVLEHMRSGNRWSVISKALPSHRTDSEWPWGLRASMDMPKSLLACKYCCYGAYTFLVPFLLRR